QTSDQRRGGRGADGAGGTARTEGRCEKSNEMREDTDLSRQAEREGYGHTPEAPCPHRVHSPSPLTAWRGLGPLGQREIAVGAEAEVFGIATHDTRRDGDQHNNQEE